jgi:ribosomal protein L16 Arg81 hydroxylase
LVFAGLTQSFVDDMKASGYEISLPRDCGRKMYELNPGDVLYVPPGFYHSPETLGDPSLHYTLTVEPACFWKDFNKDMFSKLLSSNGIFFEDYRFLSNDQKSELTNNCLNLIMSRPE